MPTPPKPPSPAGPTGPAGPGKGAAAGGPGKTTAAAPGKVPAAKPPTTRKEKLAAIAAGKLTWAEASGLTRTEAFGIAHAAHRLFEVGQVDKARKALEGLVVCNPREPYFHALLGGEYPTPFIDLAWRYQIKNSFHDRIYGAHADHVTPDVLHGYKQDAELVA
jgi:hypothetical protein